MKKIFLSIAIIAGIIGSSKADEGMWLPMLVKRLNAEDMAKKGCKLTADEIYNVNNSSVKDAIAQLGTNGRGFCTSEIVSDKSLLFTNHHCAYAAIQSHSTVEHNYLDNGFWAKSFTEELPVQGLTASILVRMDDVTAKVLEGISDTTSLANRRKMIAEATKKIETENSEDGKYTALVRDMFAGNEYYLFVYEVFKDVRLVGAPPQSIGKFGGDTDNWMWPRHTGDFAVLRIYAGKDNKPAAYSTENTPYKPKHSLPVSIKGVKENDFAMIMGFPGRTNRYITSQEMKTSLEKTNPVLIKLLGKKLETWKKEMDKSEAVRIQYSAKYAQTANGWKYYIGQNEGLERLRVLDEMAVREQKFQAWANNNDKYKNVLPNINKSYADNEKLTVLNLYLNLGALSSEAALYSASFSRLKKALEKKPADVAEIEKLTASLKEEVKEHFKDYNETADMNVLYQLLLIVQKDVSEADLPEALKNIKKAKGKTIEEKTLAFVQNAYKKSIFGSKEKTEKFLQKPDAKILDKDPLFQHFNDMLTYGQTMLFPQISKNNANLETDKRTYLEALRKFDTQKTFYPDANSTIRLTYGNVLPYNPKDGATYSIITTTDGILEKFNPKVDEFNVPTKLIDLIKAKDFGKYAENGKIPVAFIANMDITGGNSGSPVINGNGALIGIAFDGNWEAMSGDLVFDAKYKRTISVDARYILFIIDKYAGAQNLIDELKIVN